MTSPRGLAFFGFAGLALAAVLSARAEEYGEDFLTPKERKELELRRKREAQPVLACLPDRLSGAVRQGETAELVLTIRNAGGRTLRWTLRSMPARAMADVSSGQLGFGEKQVVRLIVDARDAPAGTVHDEVIIEAPGATGSPLSIPIVVEVEEAPRPETAEAAEPKPPPKPDRRPPVGPRTGGRKGAFALRAGLLLPAPGETADYGSDFALGLSYCLPRRQGARLSYELAVEIGATEEVGRYESLPLIGNLNVLFPLGDRTGSTRGYLLSGLGGMVEFVEDTATGDDYTNYAGMLNLGGGLVFGGGRFDVRLTYDILLGSDNVGGRALLGLGYGF